MVKNMWRLPPAVPYSRLGCRNCVWADSSFAPRERNEKSGQVLLGVILVVRRFRPIDAAFDFVLVCAYTGKEVV
jgi:hypothetical protein